MWKTTKEYPYQNLSLDDIEGEIWEDIPGFDGYYLISNFGRVKRQRREVQCRDGAIRVKAEKIIKLKVVRSGNNFKKDYTFFLIGKFILEERIFAFSVARMVYYCF